MGLIAPPERIAIDYDLPIEEINALIIEKIMIDHRLAKVTYREGFLIDNMSELAQVRRLGLPERWLTWLTSTPQDLKNPVRRKRALENFMQILSGLEGSGLVKERWSVHELASIIRVLATLDLSNSYDWPQWRRFARRGSYPGRSDLVPGFNQLANDLNSAEIASLPVLLEQVNLERVMSHTASDYIRPPPPYVPSGRLLVERQIFWIVSSDDTLSFEL